MQTLTTDQVKDIRSDKKDVPLINVLPQEAYAKTHIAGTPNIPADADDFIEQVEQKAGDKEQPVIVYCANESCNASPQAGKKLEAAGFKHVFDYEGGTEAWQSAGGPVEGQSA